MPTAWPAGVQLVLTGRSPAVGTQQLSNTTDRTVRRLTLDKHRLGFVEQRLGECTIASNALDDRVS